MRGNYKRYSIKKKDMAFQMLRETEKTPYEIGNELNIPVQTIYTWAKTIRVGKKIGRFDIAKLIKKR